MNSRTKWKLMLAFVAITIFLVRKYYWEDAENNTEPLKVPGSHTPVANSFLYLLPEKDENQVVHRKFYSFSYNENHEQASWVAYELKKGHLTDDDRQRPYFYEDPLVLTRSADWRNYKNSGYDRGHLCPAGDRRFSEEAYNETFFTGNIVPQRKDFNAGVWNRLENQTRNWARKRDGMIVITGGVLKDNLQTIGYETVSVPEDFYKILLTGEEGTYSSIAFLIPHEESNKDLKEFTVSIDEVEKRTGINFFYQLPDSLENALESQKNLEHWFSKQ